MNSPTTDTPMIGIFWSYGQMIFGQAINLTEGEEGVPGLLDSPANHASLWEQSRHRLAVVPGLQYCEYDQLPRGRVLWQSDNAHAIIYMDSRLFNPEKKSQISDFFSLNGTPIHWRTDAHYTTPEEPILPVPDKKIKESFRL